MKQIRHRVGIRAPCRDVYTAVSEPEKLQGWWASAATGAVDLGGQVELEFPGYPNHVWEFVELSVDQCVRMKCLSGPGPWLRSELCFEFDRADMQVFVTLTHTTAPQTPADAVQYFCTKWPLFLVSLKDFIETGKGRPYPNDIKIQHN